MTNIRPSGPAFHAGDEVVLTHGTYQGTSGVFLRLKEDVNWAEIAEHNGEVRSHPILWLAYAPSVVHGYTT